jgi:hypothetical protein
MAPTAVHQLAAMALRQQGEGLAQRAAELGRSSGLMLRCFSAQAPSRQLAASLAEHAAARGGTGGGGAGLPALRRLFSSTAAGVSPGAAAAAAAAAAGAAARRAAPAYESLCAGLPESARRQLTWWLGTCSAWVFSMVVLGGVTRLTRSGLSMTEWRFGGERPPLTQVRAWAGRCRAQYSPRPVQPALWAAAACAACPPRAPA